MKLRILGTLLVAVPAVWCQSPDTHPAFAAADVHVSAKTANPFPRTGPVRDGRYEIKTATMVDLIRIAYGFNPDKILGGPNWLELDRFDVTGKVPRESPPGAQLQMLQALLEDRFKLVLHKDTRPLPAYALVQGKKLQLKEADGSEQGGCQPQASSGPPREGVGRLMINSPGGGAPTAIAIGPDMTIQFHCRNITMAEFATGLRGMLGASLGTSPVRDETGLAGKWNFDLRYSLDFFPVGGAGGERISLQDAVEKQLGLKLEEKQVPTPVLVVDSVNRTPAENPPGTAEALPPIQVPSEFDVASVKPAGPNSLGDFRFSPADAWWWRACPCSS